MMVEEHPNSTKLNMYNRFVADTTDLLRVNPNHWLGQVYWYDQNKSRPKPAFTQPTPPPGVPLWAFRQVTQLDYLKKFIDRKSTRLNSSHLGISYAVFCL